MWWLVIAIVLIAVVLMVKGGSWYFREDNSVEYAPIKRKGAYFIGVGAILLLSLAFWNEFVYKKSQSAQQREEKRIAAICTDVVKAFNKTKEDVEASLTDMKLVQFPFLPKTSSKALGQCQFSIVATVEASHRTDGTHSKTYNALVEFEPQQETWYVRQVEWLD
ncbi:hypothetical protein ACBP46_05255 [Paenalcaligenes hominis]|uniref:hypothetical protein n=1 Tax=Paenalcaligenes hominis TaxID=643674 RepID=UPI00352420C0